MAQLEKIVKIKETVLGRGEAHGEARGTWSASDDSSTGEVANIVMDTLLVPVGMCWKDQGEMVNISLRGERRLSRAPRRPRFKLVEEVRWLRRGSRPRERCKGTEGEARCLHR